jgi:hypothetical protein
MTLRNLSFNINYLLYSKKRENEVPNEKTEVSIFINYDFRPGFFLCREYPNRDDAARGPALTGIENERPEIKQIYTSPVDLDKLPFDPMEILKHDLPWTPSDMWSGAEKMFFSPNVWSCPGCMIRPPVVWWGCEVGRLPLNSVEESYPMNKSKKYLKQTAYTFIFCMMVFNVYAQDAQWEPVTGADTLREFMAGLKAERKLPSGKKQSVEYHADGTGILHSWGGSFPRSWDVKGDDQICYTVGNEIQCVRLEKNTSD